MAHNKTKVAGAWAEIEDVHINFSKSIFSFMSNNYESGWLGNFEVRQFFFPSFIIKGFGKSVVLVGAILKIASVHSKYAKTLFSLCFKLNDSGRYFP